MVPVLRGVLQDLLRSFRVFRRTPLASATRLLEGVLAGTSPTDPVVFGSVAAILGLVGCLASWLPSRRAARVDPLVVLRQV